jgi:hypothetical protein
MGNPRIIASVIYHYNYVLINFMLYAPNSKNKITLENNQERQTYKEAV